MRTRYTKIYEREDRRKDTHNDVPGRPNVPACRHQIHESHRQEVVDIRLEVLAA